MLLIDEVDRVEVETEALLLEILSDYQVSIPELGTIEATQIPLVFLTSNNTRELSEALKRRCLFLHVDYPDLEREKEIVLTKVPGHHRQPGRPGRPHRALDPPARAEEGAVGVRDDRLGPHAACCSASSTSTPSRPRRPSTSCSSTRATSPRRSRSWSVDAAGKRVRRCSSCWPASSRSCARPACRCQPHREPRRHGGGAAHPARGPRGVQVRAGRHAGEEQRPLAGVRDGVRGLLLAAGPAVQARRGRRDADELWRRDAGADAARARAGGRRRRWTSLTPEELAPDAVPGAA